MQQATKIFNRLSAVEKITLRMAEGARLEYLAREDFGIDLQGLSTDEAVLILTEIKALCLLEFGHRSTLPFGIQ